MLQRLLIYTLLSIAVFFVVLVVSSAFKIYQYTIREQAVLQLYDIFKTCFLDNNSFKDGDYPGLKFAKIEIEFDTLTEAKVQFLELIDEALDYYDKLGWLALGDSNLKATKDELISLYSEINNLDV